METYAYIVDRSRYSKHTIDLFEVISAYYTQLFYVHFYEEGKSLKINGKVDSITDGYRHVVKHFISEYEKHDIFKRFLNDLCEYYIDCGFSHLLLTDFVHLVIREVLPDEYFKELSKHQCSVIIYRLFRSVVREFASHILNEYMSFIIDNRADKDKPRVLQDDFIDLLLLQKNQMLTKINNAEIKTDQRMQEQMVNKMRGTIQRMLEQMQKQEQEIARLRQENYKLKTIVVRINKEKKEMAVALPRAAQEMYRAATPPRAAQEMYRAATPPPPIPQHPAHLWQSKEDSDPDEETPAVHEIVTETDDLYGIF